MLSSNLVRFCRPVWHARARSGALAAYCVFAVACSSGDTPLALPPASETETDPNGTTIAEDAARAQVSVDAGTGRALEVDAAPNGEDAGSSKAPAHIGAQTPASGDAGDGSLGGREPIASGGSTPNAAPGTSMNAVDGGTPWPALTDASTVNVTVPMWTDDAGVSFACAATFAGCVLGNVLDADQCLDAYGDCEPGFRGDGGYDGTCAVHFSACVLSDPINFDRCFPLLLDCD